MNASPRLRLLGLVEVEAAGAPIRSFESRKAIALLGYLARQNQPVTRDHLANLLWGDMLEARGRRNLSRELSQLAARLPGVFQADYHTVHCPLATDGWLDTAHFEALAAAADAEDSPPAPDVVEVSNRWFVSLANPGLSPDLMAEAVALYRGEFMAGLYLDGCPEFETWLVRERELWRRRVTESLEQLIAYHALRGQDEQAERYARHWLELEPWQEDAHRYLMVLLARNGKRSAALTHYEICRRALAEELGVEPADETVALYEQIRACTLEREAPRPQSRTVAVQPARAPARRSQVWGEIPDLGGFHGRQTELAILQQRLIGDRCRLVAVIGMGGLGKTALVAKAVTALADQFACVFWYSLLNAPSLHEVLRACLHFVSDQRLSDTPGSLDDQLGLLVECLRRRRCLLVFDNVETIFQAGARAGDYLPDYAGYGQCFHMLGTTAHQSCLLLTSREQPRELARLESGSSSVCSLYLGGLTLADGQTVLAHQGLAGPGEAEAALIRRYSGNPLALKLVAETVQSLFGGDIGAFLGSETAIFDDIGDVLDQQFARLSALERDVLLWMAIEREAVTPQALEDNLVRVGSRRAILEAIRSLQRRSLLERSGSGVSLQNVVMEYATDHLIDQIGAEVEHGTLRLMQSHALVRAQAKEYIRKSQIRLILQPLGERLLARLGRSGLEEALRKRLAALQRDAPLAPGYAGANILHLLLSQGYDLRGYDFSRLCIWQADLRQTSLPAVTFAQSDLTGSAFTDSFTTVQAVAFSPDGQTLAVGTAKEGIRLWHVTNGQLYAIRREDAMSILGLAFSPDGAALAGGCSDHQVRVWDMRSGQLRYTLRGHTNWVWSVAFSPDGATLASAGFDQTIRLWDAHTGQLRHTLSGYGGQVQAIAFSPDGAVLASGNFNQTIHLWDVPNGQLYCTLSGHTNVVNIIAFSPDGALIASGSTDQTIRLWDARSGQCIRILKGHSGIVPSIAFSPDGATLLSGSYDQTVRLWDVKSGQLRQTLHEHTNEVWAVAFSPDGTTLASGSADQTVRLWDARSGQVLHNLFGYLAAIYSVAFSPDGASLVGGSIDHTVRLWDTRTNQIRHTLYGHTNWVLSVACSPDGTTIASSGADQAVRLWDARSGQLRHTLHGSFGWICGVAFSPDGATLLSGGDDRALWVWDAHTGRLRHTLNGHTNKIWTVAYSPDGATLASGSADETIRLWDAHSGQLRYTLHTPTDMPRSVAFSPDGTLLISAGSAPVVRVWDVRTGQLCGVLQGHTSRIWSVAFSPDGATVASGGTDRTVRLWNVRTGQLLATLHGHTSWAMSVAFSPDGTILASGSPDETVKLWDVQTGVCLQTLPINKPYTGMNISSVIGMSDAQKMALKLLGAVEEAENVPIPGDLATDGQSAVFEQAPTLQSKDALRPIRPLRHITVARQGFAERESV